MSRTTLTPTSSRVAPTGAQVRPSDLHSDDLPRHAIGVIPIRPRRDVIVIETAARTPTSVLGTHEDDDLDALQYSAELL